MQKILFLDIDGVLKGHQFMGGAQSCKINPENVKHLNKILDTVDNLKIVLSSSWRYMIFGGAMTLKGFEYMLRTYGVNCIDKLDSHTCSDETVRGRHFQISHWLQTHGYQLDELC